ncbi:phage baseplate plug family protein [Robbsia andropogonis]|uniref:phage baseplate plug family protein n=1 Tax=Robbsia andropogonis TaxID=28092 RepID=UPI003D1E1971
MNYYAIPLNASQETFNITLSGNVYKLTLQYMNVDSGGWFLNIADSTGAKIVSGIPLVTGVNLLNPYDYLGFAGSLWVQTKGDPDAAPTYANLGVDSKLYWVTD